MHRARRLLAARAIIALISAGCSNAAGETGTGSSGGNTTAATHEQAVKVAACMRDKGVLPTMAQRTDRMSGRAPEG